MRVEGLSEYIRDLDLAPNQLKNADRLFRMYAATTVRDMAKKSAGEQGGVINKASEDLRVTGLGRLTLSGRPFDMGAEFGSYQYKQFERWRGNGDEAGYFFWPAIREYREKSMSDDWIQRVWESVKAL